MNYGKGYKAFKAFNAIFMILLACVMLYPYLNTLAVSLNDARDSSLGGITIFPRKFTLQNYKTLLVNPDIIDAAKISVSRVAIGTAIALAVQFSAAYALEKKDLPGKNILLAFLIVPMFIGGGLIPSYILYSRLHMLNTFWMYIIPGAFSFYNALIIRIYIRNLPDGLLESARLDGANELQVLARIVVPLSMPIVATIMLYVAVAYWNDWTTTLYFVNLKSRLYTLQYVLVQFLKKSERITDMIRRARSSGSVVDTSNLIDPASLRAAQIIITTLPIVIVYPFLQKHFIKGVLIGSVKE
jgi:putative aldouronate transport system permease protein